jgi:hypothetical protein
MIMSTLAAIVIICGLVFSGYLLAGTERTAATALIFAFISSTGGIAIANLNRMRHWGAEAGKGQYSVGMDLQDAVTEIRNNTTEVKSKAIQVQTDTAEVRQIKEMVQSLATKMADDDIRIRQGESSVSEMQTALRSSMGSLVEAIYLVEYTKNIFPAPEFISKDLLDQLNVLEAFAHPEPTERAAHVKRVEDLVRQAQPPFRPPSRRQPPRPTPSPAPSANPTRKPN